MAISQEQKVDFLLKKIGFTASKTGNATDATGLSGTLTPKAGFAEAIPSPLIIANTALWNESGSIPATPPGSDTTQVKVYAPAGALRMTVDSTVANNRAFIAYTTYNNTSSARLTNWIDTQFGPDYIIQVFVNDATVSSNKLNAGGSGNNDGWFFDYSAGVLNFNDTNVPTSVSSTNVYIVGYRYIGQTGAPTSGISTFSYLDLTVERNLDVGKQGGISTFHNNIDANGIIEGIAGQNKIPSLYANYSDLPNPGTYHGMFAHVHGTQKGYFAHAGGWYELVNKELNGRVGTGTESYFIDRLVSTSTTATSLNVTGVTTAVTVDVNGDLDVDGHTNLDNVSVAGVSTFSNNVHVGTGITFETNGQATHSGIVTSRGFFLPISTGANTDNIFKAGVLKIFDNGSHLHIMGPYNKTLYDHSGTRIILTNDFRIQNTASSRTYFRGVNLGAASLYWAGSNNHGVKLATTETGIDVTGDANFSGNVSIGGTLTYEDVVNVDAVGLITARSGIRVTGGVIEAQAGENKIPSLYSAMNNLPSAGSYHGMFAHVHATGRGYFAHAGNWLELVNKEINGVVGTGTERYNIGPVDLTTLDVSGISTFAGNVDINADIDVDGHTNLDNVSASGIITAQNFDYTTNRNIRIGAGAAHTTTRYDIIAIGEGAAQNVTSDGIVALGYNAGNSQTSGSSNIYIGRQAGEKITNKNANTFVGDTAGRYVNSHSNTAVGAYALRNFNGGSQSTYASNCAFGRDSMRDATTASTNNAFGNGSLQSVGGGASNAAFGHESLKDCTGHYNTGVGRFAGKGLSTGQKNTILGAWFTGTQLTTGTNNTLLGFNATPTSITVSNEVTIGDTNVTKFRIPGIGVTFSTSGNIIPYNTIFNNDIDVDGHTNLDNVSIAGVTTHSEDVVFKTSNSTTGGEAFWDYSDGSLRFNDISKIKFGNGYDFQIYHHNNENIIGSLFGSHPIKIKTKLSGSTEDGIVIIPDGAVELYHDNIKRLETSSVGVSIPQDLDVDGHTNLDNVNIVGVTTTAGHILPATDSTYDLGSSSKQWRNFYVSNIVSAPGFGIIGPDLTVRNFTATGISTHVGIATFNNATFHDDVTFTTASGNNIVFDKSDNQLEFGNDVKAEFGANGQLEINYQSNSGNSSIQHTNSLGYLVLSGNNLDLRSTTANHVYLRANYNDGVDLYFANSKKFETTNTGINVTGNTETDTFLSSGNATFSGTITAGGATGTNGQYLKTTGSGVEWATFPTLRTRQTFTASAGQTSFSFSYTVNFIDVFLNGIKLTDSEFTATNGSSVVLAVGCFVGDIVELVSYNTVSGGGGGGGGGSLNNIVEDTTPQLGGNLDLFNKTITGTGNINMTGVATATKFVGDGSGLTNVIGSGSGVVVKNSGSNVGTAGTIDFGSNLSVSPISAGIVTITGSIGITTNSGVVSIANNLDVDGDLDVDGHTNLDNVSIAGFTTFAQTIRCNSSSTSVFTGGIDFYQANVTSGNITFVNNRGVLFGGSGYPFQIYHNNGASIISHNGTGSLNIMSKAGEYAMRAYRDGAVELYHDNTKRFETTSQGINIIGHSELDNVNIAGVVTAQTYKGALEATSASFSSNIDANGDLDVDGHTNLDNVNIAGVTSCANSIHLNQAVPSIEFNSTTHDNDFRIINYQGNFIVQDTDAVANRFEIASNGTVNFLNNVNANGGLQVTQNATFNNDIDVDGHTNLDNVNVGGATTTTGVVVINAGTQSTNTTTGALRVAGGVGVVKNVNVGGDLDVDGHTNLDNVSVAGVVTATSFVGDGSGLTNLPGGGSYGNNDVDSHLNVSGASSGQILSWNGSDYAWVADQTGGGGSGISTISGVVNIANDLDVDGHTNLDNVSVAGVSTFAGITTVTGNTLFAKQLGVSGVSTFTNSVRISGTLPDFTVDSGTFRYDGGKLFMLRSGVDARYYSGTPGGAKGPHVFYTHQGGSSVEMLRLNGDTGATLVGVMTATSFSGDGSNLTGVNANVGITTNLSGTFTASAGSPSTINTFGYGSGDIVVEYTVFIKNGSDFQSQKLLAMRDGTTIHSTQFAVMFSSSLLVQLDATISGGNILLRATPETGVSGSTTYKIKREVM